MTQMTQMKAHVAAQTNRFTRTVPIRGSFLLIGALALNGCLPTDNMSADNSVAKEEIRMSKLDVNKYPVTKTVCDPWGGTPDPRSNLGLKAELWWLPSGVSPKHDVGSMIANGTATAKSLFFSDLNVPTRLFQMGFASETGETVKDDSGSTLIEYFALRFKSILRLAPTQKAGLYQFAVLSDDGAILKLRDSEGNYTANVANDGDHPTRLGCGVAPIAMDSTSEVPMVLDYYQGPRYHISLIVLMREVAAGQAPDPACGLTGNKTWFNPDDGSKPQKAYTDLLARGWAPLGKENFALSNEVMFNPCKDGERPTIKNLMVFERFNDGFVVSWNTDIPATSQIAAKDPSGVQTITISDNILRTSHEVRITGLKASTDYSLQAVSISETYGRMISDPIAARTDD